MGKNQNTEAAEADAGPISIGRALWTFTWKWALGILLVYGALQIWVRTNSFRSLVEKELSERTGMEMRVGRIRATGSLNLRFRDIISVSEVAGIEARRTRLRWRLFRPRREPMLESIWIDGLALTIAPDETGVVQPAFLGSVSKKVFEWSGVPVPAPMTSAKEAGGGVPTEKKPTPGLAPGPARWGSGPLEFRGVTVRWQDAEGRLLASLSGMDLTWRSMALPNGKRVAHVDCRVGEIKMVNGPRIMGLHVELIDTGDRQFLVALEAMDWGAAKPPRPVEAEYREMLDAMDEDLR